MNSRIILTPLSLQTEKTGKKFGKTWLDGVNSDFSFFLINIM